MIVNTSEKHAIGEYGEFKPSWYLISNCLAESHTHRIMVELPNVFFHVGTINQTWNMIAQYRKLRKDTVFTLTQDSLC